ncbi:MAG: hypothetical protein MUF54_25685 [Polyangiaceae bacterium]|nr:hypothetical protein [Polyangiaceae bacterium]
MSWLGTTSPFNITAEAATLEPFNREDVHALLLQHTDHTEQQWEQAAMDRIYDLSQGHPWLVNGSHHGTPPCDVVLCLDGEYSAQGCGIFDRSKEDVRTCRSIEVQDAHDFQRFSSGTRLA